MSLIKGPKISVKFKEPNYDILRDITEYVEVYDCSVDDIWAEVFR